VVTLVAVSGGADSVALLRAMCETRVTGKGELVAAHLNHGLRAAESDADEQFVREICSEMQVRCCTERVDVAALAATQGDGIEAAARTARYQFLRRTAGRCGARYVATAHTADDEVETVLHRILRGTALAGLAGIPRRRLLGRDVMLVRPLLAVRRREVLAYLAAIGQAYREDASNAEPIFTRNRLRLELLPLLRAQYNPDVDQALLRLADHAGELQQIIERQTEALSQTAEVTAVAERRAALALFDTADAAVDESAVILAVPALAQAEPYVVRELFKRLWQKAGWSRQQLGRDALARLGDLAQGGVSSAKQVFPGDIVAQRQAGYLILRRLPPG